MLIQHTSHRRECETFTVQSHLHTVLTLYTVSIVQCMILIIGTVCSRSQDFSRIGKFAALF